MMPGDLDDDTLRGLLRSSHAEAGRRLAQLAVPLARDLLAVRAERDALREAADRLVRAEDACAAAIEQRGRLPSDAECDRLIAESKAAFASLRAALAGQDAPRAGGEAGSMPSHGTIGGSDVE